VSEESNIDGGGMDVNLWFDKLGRERCTGTRWIGDNARW